MLADTRMGPAEWLEQESVAGSVVEAYHRLEIKEQEIVQLSFGFDGDAPFTNADIGRRYGISRERVRQLRTNSVRKMRHHVVGAAA
jgi:RNA polymerase nonessential primary-like sigma factor